MLEIYGGEEAGTGNLKRGDVSLGLELLAGTWHLYS
jgi:hypothetical protein